MVKISKKLIILAIAVSLFQVGFLIIFHNTKIGEKDEKIIKGEDFLAGYKNEIKIIFNKCETLLSSDLNGSGAQISESKNRLTEIKVPEEFKNLHLDLFMVLISMEKFLEDGKKENLEKSEGILSRLRNENNWLN